MNYGKVYLVGAGPGDPALITLKGMECLKLADVVIYDRLLDDSLLDWAQNSAEKIYAGKASSKHALSQHEINRLLVEKAMEGKNVVRLKGGDPFVLGRGGEEADELKRNNIDFEVVPGITSAIAVPAYAGIPVTQRGVASSFTVITGHEDPRKSNSSLSWTNLASDKGTLIFLMGMQNLPEITSKLLEHGMKPSIPVAVVKDGTRPNQQVVTGTLSDIVSRVKESQLGTPAIIVVGEVVKLRERLTWFDCRPLFGKRILITRARRQASSLSKLLSERGAVPIELPAIAVSYIKHNDELKQAIKNVGRYERMIFTSVNGVEAFFQILNDISLDARALKGFEIGVIGLATAEALSKKGIRADFMPDVFTTDGLIACLKERKIKGSRFLLPRADIADAKLANALIELGAEVHEITAYRTSPATETIEKAKEMLLDEQIDVITFTSSSTVSNLINALDGAKLNLNRLKIASIGPKTTETIIRAGWRADIQASEQTIPGLVKAIEGFFKTGE